MATSPSSEPPTHPDNKDDGFLEKLANASVGGFGAAPESSPTSEPPSTSSPPGPSSANEQTLLDKITTAFTPDKKPDTASQSKRSPEAGVNSHLPTLASAVSSQKTADAGSDGSAAKSKAKVDLEASIAKLGLRNEHDTSTSIQHALETLRLTAKHSEAPPLPIASTSANSRSVLDHIGLGLDHHDPPLVAMGGRQMPVVSSRTLVHHNVLDELGLGLDPHRTQLPDYHPKPTSS
ncbi:hypothetical protein MIND_01094700 [Mycena indigotica]|uniref:Uncharacterized protein n=1 Tax=Mycena indigotica TaxID=2126181 RepID=A0A8H6VVM0_9AGAR|nr:uncharacterized protein MIND_01094700 [Mycena indigotica]KAF7295547.1 hypothetical protein MIND_01094700 [Mycena indigotica]